MEVKFLKTRKVKSPLRAHSSDAGIDFYIPEANQDFINDFVKKNIGHTYRFIGYYTYNDMHVDVTFDVSKYDSEGDLYEIYDNMLANAELQFNDIHPRTDTVDVDKIVVDNFEIVIPAHERVLVPSGIKTYITPVDSALIATNKSGVATKKGLTVGATTVDSHYSGEVHLSVINTGSVAVSIECNNKLVQFIHTPVYLSVPEEIFEEEYNKLTNSFDRGAGGFGSSGLN